MGYFRIHCLRRSGVHLTVWLCLGFSALVWSADDSDFEVRDSSNYAENKPFWVAWNDYVTELIRRELEVPDPWEPMNRKIFAFNEWGDRVLLTPAAKTYRWLTPDFVEQGIGNMFANLLEVTTIVNDILQLKFGQAAADSGRFVINSTVGLLGFFDVAAPLGLERHEEDFGQTMGFWGVGTGPYLMVPIFGPYTLRDGIGSFPDNYTDYLLNLEHIPSRNMFWVFRNVHDRSELFTAEELITGDRYTFIRDAYLQRRVYLVNDGVIEDDFGDEDEWGEQDWAE
ncbi:VacJ family lipoprotein [Oceanicoccus sp. KOV_DT_Chl]|uniref:MlaA family lipoprotein n=1 Tax=Oceanicoccus sp. KOV_DT_Chl TaxID=1904639 RepID=UPI0013575F87|nr:VacJ family lipoprotein [Oceanicoccus sp. KOV_DT_Chl]